MNYELAREVAWRVLINNKVSSLPVDVFKICKAEGIFLFTYAEADSVIKELDLSEHTKANDAFCFNRYIFYDNTKHMQRQRFSIAHELGHILLHLNNSPYLNEKSKSTQKYNIENGDSVEAEANIFASRLLCPLCVLQFLNVSSVSDVERLCNISYSAARLRYSRLCKIRKRNKQRLLEKGHGTFLLEGYERLVLDNFKEFIENNKLESKVTEKNKDDRKDTKRKSV